MPLQLWLSLMDKQHIITVKGFPGWHIECTAMGVKYLGERFDVHTGGIDHIPIHHTNEIAQAQGAFGHDHVRFWLHNEFLVDDSGKMAKSKGDFLRLKTIVDKGYSPLDYRYFLLLTHYRKPVMFSWAALDAAAKARKRLVGRVIELKTVVGIGSGKPSEDCLAWQQRFVGAINDDLNTPQAIAVVNELLKSDLADSEKLSLVLDWDQVLGLDLRRAERSDEEVPSEILALVAEREEARKNKDWARADELRDAISAQGFVVSDTPDGPRTEKQQVT
jgi:cysteinyl-tRNA synthetase